MSDQTEKYSGSKKVEKIETKKATSKMVTVTFRDNRKFDLHIGREMVTFKGRETKSIPSAYLTHKDWVQVKHLFVVKGV